MYFQFTQIRKSSEAEAHKRKAESALCEDEMVYFPPISADVIQSQKTQLSVTENSL